MVMRRAKSFFMAFLVLLGLSAAGARPFEDGPDGQPGPKSPRDSLALMKARPGFVVELVAAEPLVQDPIALAFGADGKLWVVEMGDYPRGLDDKGAAGGRVKFLEDIDGDGQYEKATIFLSNLPFPTGVFPWRKGVIVTAAPDILYAEDTDGDGKADKRVTLFTGFVEGNQQHRVNGLTWSVDGWVYGANGDSGGRIRSLKSGKEVDIRGRDFRLRPETGELEAITGQTQFGRCTTDWGDWFGGNNANPLWHFALDEHYMRRNPHLPPPNARVDVPAVPGTAPVFPLSRTLPRFNDYHTANRFTSACSPILYRDTLFGSDFVDNVFICEPVHNLVHREILSAKGTTFASKRASDEGSSEFLASADNWFRPTMARVGPDGALYVCDMYRHVIEHPQWIPLDWQKKLDLRAGHDRGRIYRVRPQTAPRRAVPRLSMLKTADLVAALDSPSAWQRDMAQMLLLERNDRASFPLLERLLETSPRPQARLHALCTLAEMNALRQPVHIAALVDAHPGVRRHAVRLGERSLPAKAIALIHDGDAQVRMQTAYSLGESKDPEAADSLGRMARMAVGDRFLTAAVMSSVQSHNFQAVLSTALQRGQEPLSPVLLENFLRMASALGGTEATGTLLKTVARSDGGRFADWQFAALATLLDTLDARNASLAKLSEETKTRRELSELFAAARSSVRDAKAPRERRAEALRLLGRGWEHQTEDAQLLSRLLVPQTPDEVQTAAVAALGRLRGVDVPALLLEGWKGHAPALRGQVLEVLSRRDDWLTATLNAIETKQIAASEIDALRRQRLVDHKDAAVRDRARRLLAGAASPDRIKVLEGYARVAKLSGDATRGQAVFVKSCSACHKLVGIGNEVGPDLAGLTDRSTDTLLAAILDPNRAVETRYINYLAELKSGLTLTGVLSAESASSLTLITADGKPHVLLRGDLESLTSTGRSAMPEGLEKDVSPEDMASLFAFLRRAPTPTRKVFAGNNPTTVKPSESGVVRLTAETCAIYGKTLVWEPKHRNLGYWQSEDDHALWTFEVSQAGRYEVWLEYACNYDTAGDSFLLLVGDQRLSGKIATTGTWDDYRQTRIGTLQLSTGEQKLIVRPDGKPRRAMMDLRALRLVPIKDGSGR